MGEWFRIIFYPKCNLTTHSSIFLNINDSPNNSTVVEVLAGGETRLQTRNWDAVLLGGVHHHLVREEHVSLSRTASLHHLDHRCSGTTRHGHDWILEKEKNYINIISTEGSK